MATSEISESLHFDVKSEAKTFTGENPLYVN